MPLVFDWTLDFVEEDSGCERCFLKQQIFYFFSLLFSPPCQAAVFVSSAIKHLWPESLSADKKMPPGAVEPLSAGSPRIFQTLCQKPQNCLEAMKVSLVWFIYFFKSTCMRSTGGPKKKEKKWARRSHLHVSSPPPEAQQLLVLAGDKVDSGVLQQRWEDEEQADGHPDVDGFDVGHLEEGDGGRWVFSVSHAPFVIGSVHLLKFVNFLP